MAERLRICLYWDDGTIDTARAPIDAEARIIVRTAKDGARMHRHVEVTDDLGAEGYRMAIEVPDEP